MGRMRRRQLHDEGESGGLQLDDAKRRRVLLAMQKVLERKKSCVLCSAQKHVVM